MCAEIISIKLRNLWVNFKSVVVVLCGCGVFVAKVAN